MQGWLIPELAPKFASSIGGEHVSHRREELRGVPIIAMPPTTSGEALSTRAHGRSEGVLPITPLVPETRMLSTYELMQMGPFAPLVSLRLNQSLKPSMRMKNTREEATAFFLGRTMHDSRRVRLANF